jgi:hypothetical protein
VQNKYAFTPNTYMALAFWGVQTLVQLYWVRNLFIYDATEIGALEALPYAPLYAAGTVCLGASARAISFIPRLTQCRDLHAPLCA